MGKKEASSVPAVRKAEALPAVRNSTIIVRLFLSAIVLANLFLICSPASAENTESHPVIRFRFVNEQEEPVILKEAKLLLVAWGYTSVIELEHGKDVLNLSCDETWLRERSPERFQNLEAAYLYVAAEGYMKKRSEPIIWPGTYNNKSSTCDIGFPGGPTVNAGSGESSEMPVTFRKPGRKFLRFVDEVGKPVAGVKVTASLFWSSSNHCGVLSGAWKQGEGISGEDGLVQIPDGEYENVFEFGEDGPNWFSLAYPQNSAYPRRMVAYLTQEITEVPLAVWKRRPLVLRVTSGGIPAVGLSLQGCLSEDECQTGSCGICCGYFGTTDEDGAINIPNFYPEKYGSVYVLRQLPEGERGLPGYLWEADPNDWPEEETVEIALPDESARVSIDSIPFADSSLKNCISEAGYSYADEVRDLLCAGRGIKNLSGIERLEFLERMYFQGNDITDIRPLGGLTRLRHLNLSGSKIGDIAPLASLTRLRALFLDRTGVEDIGPLSSIAELRMASLSTNRIKDIRPLSGLKKLTSLGLSYNLIDDIASLSDLHRLAFLELNNNKIVNVGSLGELRQLQFLKLRNNEVSAGLADLRSLNRLRLLDITGNRPSCSELSALIEALDVQVVKDEGTCATEQ